LNKTTNLKTTYSDSTIENVELLINYFKTIGGKEISMSSRRQNAFKTKWTTGEDKLRNRCHIQNASEYLESIKNNFSKEQIKIVIADIAKYVNSLDENEDVNFILLSTNTLPSAIHFIIAENLFLNHQIRDDYKKNYNIDLLTIYSLRLSLESRIKGLLGIDYASNNGKPVGLNTLIKISKNIESVKYSTDFKWIEIEWVNEWINHHMHRLLRPYPWIIHQAISTLKPFVDPKEPVEIGKSIRYSFYSATFVENEEELHSEIETKLKAVFPKIEIKWNNGREIMRK
jgi:hypothetical protein